MGVSFVWNIKLSNFGKSRFFTPWSWTLTQFPSQDSGSGPTLLHHVCKGPRPGLDQIMDRSEQSPGGSVFSSSQRNPTTSHEILLEWIRTDPILGKRWAEKTNSVTTGLLFWQVCSYFLWRLFYKTIINNLKKETKHQKFDWEKPDGCSDIILINTMCKQTDKQINK